MTEVEQAKTKQLIEQKRDEIRRIARKHGAFNVRLFGSVAREEDRLSEAVRI